LIENASIPYSIVNATQFFESIRRIADAVTEGVTIRMAPVLFQPIAGDDVARAVAEVAVGSPLGGRIEIAGPERFRMDRFFRDALAAWEGLREVAGDPHARSPYFGSELGERTLVPDDGAVLGEVRYGDWAGRITAGG
jgi:uncharacterized protein YbjT (DUF2867 family)